MSSRILVVDDSATIRKVVAGILAAHSFEPVLAADGEEALALLQTEPVDLVLLDFVMPNMNGYQFCRELRADRVYRLLPVVLMSAKSDRIRGQFIEQTGAVDAIGKPFDARGLIAVIEGALNRQKQGRVRPVPDPSSMPEDESVLERPSRSLSDDPAARPFQAAEELRQAIEDLLAPELEELLPTFDRDRLRVALDRAIRPDVLGPFTALVKSLEHAGNLREVLAGDISVISIAEVLQMLDLQRQSGALSVTSRHQEITLHIQQGALAWAESRGLGDEFLLGRYLVQAGAVERDELQDLLDRRKSKQLLGEALTSERLITSEQLTKALRRQASELLYEVVRWKTGRFSFVIGVEHPIAKKAALNLETGSLVMEGFRRVDEWRLIEGSFDFDEVLYPDPVAIERLGNENNLTVQERSVLEAIDGARTIREIVDEMEGSSFDLCKIVYQFLNSRLVRRKAA
jgi:DNA-binding response OmpR family regulator